MKRFAVFAVAVMLAPAALAPHQNFVVNPDASEVKMTLKTVRGSLPGISRAKEDDPNAAAGASQDSLPANARRGESYGCGVRRKQDAEGKLEEL
jgi:hypothetical protein